MEDAEIGHALDLAHLGHHALGELLEHLEIRPDDLDRIGALHARQRLFDVVLDVLRKIKADAGQLFLELLLQDIGELGLVEA